MAETKSISNKYNYVLTILSLIFSIGIAEAFLRIVAPHDSYYLIQQNVNSNRDFYEEMLVGINGTTTFSSNSLGIRGDEFSEQQDYRILTIGGSTTECMVLDDEEAWPKLLQSKLNKSQSELNYWVGNIGVSAHYSGSHMLALEKLLPQFPKIDEVIVLVGINDFFKTVYQGGHVLKHENSNPNLIKKTFRGYPRNVNSKWHQRTEIWMHLRDAKYSWQNLVWDVDRLMNQVEEAKNFRKNSPKVNKLPPLAEGLKNFEVNIKLIFNLLKEKNIKFTLLTQPSLYHEGLTEAESQYLYGGAFRFMPPASDSLKFYSANACYRGLKEFNDISRSVANELNIFLIDLAVLLSKDSTTFYDHCHFNESGSAKVADLLFRSIKQ